MCLATLPQAQQVVVFAGPRSQEGARQRSTGKPSAGREDSDIVVIIGRDAGGRVIFSDSRSARACVPLSSSDPLRPRARPSSLQRAGRRTHHLVGGRTVGLQYLSQHMLYRGSPWVLYLTDDTDLMYNDRPRILARMGLLISVPPTLGFGIALVIRR